MLIKTYPLSLTSQQTIIIPTQSTILGVTVTDENSVTPKPHLHVAVNDTDTSTRSLKLITLTEGQYGPNENTVYLGSYSCQGGRVVAHVFEYFYNEQ